VVYRPEGMTAEQRFGGFFVPQKAIYTVPAIVRRLRGTTSRANFWLVMNYGARRSIQMLTARAWEFRSVGPGFRDTTHDA